MKKLNHKKLFSAMFLGGALAFALNGAFAQEQTGTIVEGAAFIGGGEFPMAKPGMDVAPEFFDEAEQRARGLEMEKKATDASGNTWEAYTDNGRIIVKTSDGSLLETPWFVKEAEGNLSLALDKSDTPYVAFSDAASGGKISVIKWNGADWEFLGTPGFSEGDVSMMSISVNERGKVVLAYTDSTNADETALLHFEEGEWRELTGNQKLDEGMEKAGRGICDRFFAEPSYIIWKGSYHKGDGVRWVQCHINMFFGGNLVVDGSYGPLTWGAVETLQKTAYVRRLGPVSWVPGFCERIGVDGSTGPVTRRKMLNCYWY